jgi:type I restriction enzyme S subunit
MKLGDITRESRETFKGDKTGIPIVGLEHLIPQELTFSTYDVDTDNTFTKMFHKGQILFGRRRAYLKKAAVAEFDGICSGDITVIEAIPGKVDKDLLPFIIQNDALFDYAVSRSAGGLSPRVKWEQLSDYEINLPPLEEQKVLADKLWAAYRLKEGYKKLLCATDEMVKSQFIEMFGDAEKKPFVDVCINKGEYGSNSPADDYDGNIRYVRITDITEEGNLNSLVVSPRKVEEKYMLLRDDLLFARTGNTVGKTYLHRSGRMIFAGYLIRYRLNNKLMLPQFAFAYTHTNQYYDWVEKIKKVGAQPNISAAQYDSMPIPVPSMAKQIEFVSIAKQADKSKSYVRIAFKNLESMLGYCIRQIS